MSNSLEAMQVTEKVMLCLLFKKNHVLGRRLRPQAVANQALP